jgi:hypothetical protein
MNVPFVLSKSSITQALLWRVMRAWRRDTWGWSITMSFRGSRPRVTLC